MPDPHALCSLNCGDEPLIAEFILVTIPFRFGPYLEYVDGVVYQYVGIEDTRCVWERRPPKSTFWEIERLSRYWDGWNFPFTEPIADKWTWRLSLDRLSLPTVLNGWSKDFPRFAPDVSDPDKNCASIQDLDNYVPFHPFGWIKARVDPLVSLSEARTPKKSIDPCFCTTNCPLGTKPFEKYLVTHSGTPFLPGYDTGRLWEIIHPVGGYCAYLSNVAETPPANSELDRRELLATSADHAYSWVLVLTAGPGVTKTYVGDFEWNDDDGPFPKIEARCDQTVFLDNPDGTTARLRPVPAWICSDSQAIAWSESHPPT